MRRLHVIDEPHRMGGEMYFRHADKYAHDPELLEAYHCGVKQGWKEAMEELESGGYHERNRYGRTLPPMMREHEREWDGDDEIVKYRRRRRANGEFY